MIFQQINIFFIAEQDVVVVNGAGVAATEATKKAVPLSCWERLN